MELGTLALPLCPAGRPTSHLRSGITSPLIFPEGRSWPWVFGTQGVCASDYQLGNKVSNPETKEAGILHFLTFLSEFLKGGDGN